MTRIAPSLLAADPLHLGEAVQTVAEAGADWFHFDVMDGAFVPNLALGPAVCAAVRPHVRGTLDVHLMTARAEDWIDRFVAHGADLITIHAEAEVHLHRVLQRVREAGVGAGLGFAPLTPLTVLDQALPYLDMVLLMTVNPGFGGQSWIPGSERRIADARERIDRLGENVTLMVDGGIDIASAALAGRAGADVLVAGSAVFGGGTDQAGARYRELLDAANDGPRR